MARSTVATRAASRSVIVRTLVPRLLIWPCAVLTKLAITEGSVDNALAAVNVHGAEGYLTEFGVERNLRDLLGSTIYSGTSDVQRNVIARLIGVTS